MQATISNLGDVIVADITGELDGSTAPIAQQEVLGATKDGSKIILNLTNVPYMSSAGLRMLLATYRQVTNTGGKMVCVGVVDEIKDTMTVTGFIKFFTLTDTVDEALVALKA